MENTNETIEKRILEAEVYDLYEIFTANILNSYEDASTTQVVNENLDKKIQNPEEGGNITDEFMALFYAIYAVYKIRTGDTSTDILGFLHILNILAHQASAEDYEKQIKLLQKQINVLSGDTEEDKQ